MQFGAVMPAAEHLDDPRNPARAGLVRHGGLGKPTSHVPAHYKRSYRDHLKMFVNQQGSRRARSSAFLVLGSRNSFQNLLLPIWLAGRFIHRLDEPWQTTTYTALCRVQSGTLVIQKVRFRESSSGIVVKGESGEPVQLAVVGQPILFRSEIPPVPLLAAMTYDQRHIVHLLWEDWQTQALPELRWHRDAHDELMSAFMANLNAPVATRAAALADIVARRGLQEEDGYLHSSLGLTPDGSVVLLMMTGSLGDHGRMQRRLGAESAILLDNGGSVGAAYWPATADPRGLDDVAPRVIGAGSYFRDSALTTLVFELDRNFLEAPFAPRRPGDDAFTDWSVS